MLAELPEIYMVVVAEPSDDFITQRQKVIDALVADSVVGKSFVDWLSLIQTGLVNAKGSTESIQLLVDAIRNIQPSFPSDPAQRLLDLRVTAIAVLWQYLVASGDSNGEHAGAVAAAVMSACNLRHEWSEPRLGALVRRFEGIARTVLDEEGAVQRERVEVPAVAPRPGDASAMFATLFSSLTEIRQALANNMRADQEELQVLWWVFGRTSRKLKKPYAELPAGDAALAAAIELYELMLMPPSPNAPHIVASLVEDKPNLSLSDLIRQTSTETLKMILPPNETLVGLVNRHPDVYPLIWLASRQVESERSPWEQEFEKRSQLSAATQLSVADWSDQVLSELVALNYQSTLMQSEQE